MDPNENAPAAIAEVEDTIAAVDFPELDQDTAPAAEQVAATPEPAKAEPEGQHPFWYRKEIEKERKRAAAMERELEQLRSRAPQPERQAPPDPLEDPSAFYGHIEQRLERQRLVDRLERSEDRFIDKLGEQTLDEVREWLSTRSDIEQWALQQRDPWKAAHTQYTREKMAAEIGDDPKGYEERLREKIRAEMAAERDPQPQPQMRPTLPGVASTVRNTAPRDDAGRFAPTPISAATKNRF